MAAEQAIDLSHQLEEWEAEQTRALNAHLRAHTSSGRVRLGLAHRLIPTLAAHPVVDAADVAAREGVSDNTARAALESLAEAGVVGRDRKADRTRTVYVATTLLDLITPLGPAAPGGRATSHRATAASTADPAADSSSACL